MRKLANTAAHNGSVASNTEASLEDSFPSAIVSPTRLAAVVINPVNAAANATFRNASFINKPGSVKEDLTLSSRRKAPCGDPNEKRPSITPNPSRAAHIPANAADIAHCIAVMGRA